MSVSFEEAFLDFRRHFLGRRGVVGVSRGPNIIVVYVESEADARDIPRVWRGYPVEVRVVGRLFGL
jgi:hypothetical protein